MFGFLGLRLGLAVMFSFALIKLYQITKLVNKEACVILNDFECAPLVRFEQVLVKKGFDLLLV